MLQALSRGPCTPVNNQSELVILVTWLAISQSGASIFSCTLLASFPSVVSGRVLTWGTVISSRTHTTITTPGTQNARLKINMKCSSQSHFGVVLFLAIDKIDEDHRRKVEFTWIPLLHKGHPLNRARTPGHHSKQPLPEQLQMPPVWGSTWSTRQMRLLLQNLGVI